MEGRRTSWKEGEGQGHGRRWREMGGRWAGEWREMGGRWAGDGREMGGRWAGDAHL